jgi:trk system potassium uptake protein TrkH
MNKFLSSQKKRYGNLLYQFPSRMLVLAFIILIMTGTLLLLMPVCSRTGGINFIDALFTSTSASCVTGLTVLNTGSTFSLFGQIIILLLVQVGGLGIMTFSTLFILIAGKKPSFTGQLIIQDSYTQTGDRPALMIIRDVIAFTLVIEAIGATLLFGRFVMSYEPGNALYISIFHTVSAFCNAGFSLFTNSFLDFQVDWVINIVISFLIICGGIGFLVFMELRKSILSKGRYWTRLSLHTRLALSATFIVLTASVIIILAMEWKNSLSQLSIPYRILAAFFQAVSSRTAGFNTLVISNLANETLFFLILLMFIGACPGSCGGGIKLTTVSALIISGFSRLSGRNRPQIFKRTISQASIERAISIVLISSIIIIAGTMLLLMSELGETPHPMSRGKFLEILFEIISAFGTVGLTTGITEQLSAIGKVILIIVMFIGRLGPLTIALSISRQNSASFYYAEENIMVG